eukprot:TRINITY_DN33592_c2_g2_i1.p1 TRINITY_DN33592_c2_g2~~TRINITY_DN33592_c2_g2_i1.p1  ORF type:complete len:238 (-),score=34.14 TRINITY_DN33592_c2_g2_i1:12-725(-)
MANRRRDHDVMKLMMSDYEVELKEDPTPEAFEFTVKFPGPKETHYEGGVWDVHVTLPAGYPFKSPSIGFLNRMFHPNVDERSGSVCLDVINQTWSPMFDLINIFDMFLPQLLRYPNPSDPLNGEAAALMLREPEKYKERIAEYVVKYASGGGSKSASGGAGDDGRKLSADMDSSLDVSRASSMSGDGGGSSGGSSGGASLASPARLQEVDDGGDGDGDDDDDDASSVASDVSELSDL